MKTYIDKVRALVQSQAAPKVFVETYGCQQNEADSERIVGMAVKMGYGRTDTPDNATLIIVNTCAIREHAELKALSRTGRYKKLKENNPRLLLGMCGCMVQQAHRREDVYRRYPYVNCVFGTNMLAEFPKVLYETMMKKKRQFAVEAYDPILPAAFPEGLPVQRESNRKAWVSIMYGCNNFCTYCVVPYTRGRERSREMPHILEEIKRLIGEGYKEITLLGQNVNSYGKDLNPKTDFPNLLQEISKLEGEFVLHFMTSHPKDANEELFRVLASDTRFSRHVHLPVQSGSNHILKSMNRRYTREAYLEKVKLLRQYIPDVVLTTDVIVGFPGETEEDFADTLKMLEEVRYDSVFSFVFSKRKGTPAADMDNQVEDKVSKERMGRLLDTQIRIAGEKNSAYTGKTIRVLIEGESKASPDMLAARTATGKLVHFIKTPAGEQQIGNFVHVIIERGDPFALWAKPL